MKWFYSIIASVGILLFFTQLTWVNEYCGKEGNKSNKPTSSSKIDGIDVSHHNGVINWRNVSTKNKNLRFVYIKATEGATHQDKNYSTNVTGCRKNNLNVGSYHYFTMTATPRNQFNNFRNIVDKEKQDLIPMIDVELYRNKHGYHINDYYVHKKSHRQKMIHNLGELINMVEEEYGAKPMLYCSIMSYNQLIKGNYDDCPIYVGRYGKNLTHPGIKDYTIWQYSERGRIAGIRGAVDLCRFGNGKNVKNIELSKEKKADKATENAKTQKAKAKQKNKKSGSHKSGPKSVSTTEKVKEVNPNSKNRQDANESGVESGQYIRI